MRIRERAMLTLESAKSARKILVEKLARKVVQSAGLTFDLDSRAHWADVGRYNMLDEILCEGDK